MDKGMKFKICKVCGGGFEVTKDEHYISRDVQTTCMASMIGKKEPREYDTFDCPHCGCQNIMQERKIVVFKDDCCLEEEDHELIDTKSEDKWVTAEVPEDYDEEERECE